MIDERYVSLAHGNGGRFMRALIEEIFAIHLANPDLDTGVDAAKFELAHDATPFITTDGFTVQPLEFPGGDIGSLAVNGTVNDLAVSGAVPRYLTLSAIIEEGLDMACLERITKSLAETARDADVRIIAGDTKVVPRGQGGRPLSDDNRRWNASEQRNFGLDLIRPGDLLMVSGPVGDHAVAVMLARQDFDLGGSVRSDCACVTPLVSPIADIAGVRFMRDPTRGGLATVAHEIAASTKLDVRLNEAATPVRETCARSARCSATIRTTSLARAASLPLLLRRMQGVFWTSGALSPRGPRPASSEACAKGVPE